MKRPSNHINNFEAAELSRYLLAIREAGLTKALRIQEHAFTESGQPLPGHYSLELRGDPVDLSAFWKAFEALRPHHPRINIEAVKLLFRR